MDNEYVKQCTRCKESKNISQFQQIITRRDYNIGCDMNGYSFFAKETKLCNICRTISQIHIKTSKERKLKQNNKMI